MDNILNVIISSKYKDDDNYKQARRREIIHAICALLNSSGGKLNICFEESSRSEVHSLVRTVEQRFTDIIGGIATCKKVLLKSTTSTKFIFYVEGLSNLCTMNYNLFLPSATQVKCIDPNEPISVIQRILDGKQRVNRQHTTKLGSHHKLFIKGEAFAGLLEHCVQCKAVNVKSGSSVGDQITNKASKFRMNVSALANDCGGHIYHGINSGMVKGIEVLNEERITGQVENAVTKLIWPDEPLKGKHWDIYFETVKDNEGHEVPSVFVIVISITACPGGVFVYEPESYHVVEGKVQKMTFKVWRQELKTKSENHIAHDFDEWVKSIEFPGVHDGCVQNVETQSNKRSWTVIGEPGKSLETEVMRYHRISEKLMYHINNGDKCDVECFIRRVNRECAQTDVNLITLAHEIYIACIAGLFQTAKRLLKDLNSRLFRSQNTRFFQVIELELRSTLERSMGNFETSFKYSTEALKNAEDVCPALRTAWLNVNAAIVLTVLLGKEKRPVFRERMKLGVVTYHDKALKDASTVHGFPMTVSDLQQMVYINNAFLQLGCSLSGQMVDKALVTDDDVGKAKNSLLMFSECILEGSSQSRLREAQHNLALSALSLRLAYLSDKQVKEHLQIAVGYSQKALKLANENNFEEMSRYSLNYLAVLTENLVREWKIDYEAKKMYK